MGFRTVCTLITSMMLASVGYLIYSAGSTEVSLRDVAASDIFYFVLTTYCSSALLAGRGDTVPALAIVTTLVLFAVSYPISLLGRRAENP
ncbi:MAG: hypothetical protein ETSY1_34570 [Candidatus Entotheonella factor]|uniref:Uncharacterized protein n=1 Tax=Entotheonella factor TaxID=1429438 RepID=W4LB12_ENTF1|nr:hypothetical protein [Candidatus Entotheonella palauensis]ETW94506.1 MAG: hypothetical protein ETSY1_34570 [Candidatus Entotheonella factor]